MATTAERCAKWHARYDEIMDQLAGLPAAGSASEGGRSLTASASELEKQLEIVIKQAASLGCPVGTMGDPAVLISRARA
jgi:hypothetical protein